MEDLKQKAVRGSLAKLFGQATNFALRILSLVLLARLLDPNDFGLVAMVTAVTGLYGLFTTAGLSTATIQSQTITDEQISNLFWINVLVGAALAALCLVTAPALARFYGEPRLFWITVITAAGFLFNAAGVQHFALLHRQLRYFTLTVIETISQFFGVVISIGLAVAGFGYWAIVIGQVLQPTIGCVCAWIATAWIPKLPRRNAEVGSMLRFGGTVTLNSLIVYAAYNFEKVLLGRFWGADALGLYGRAYQLINVPTDNLNQAVGGVAFSALSRLQDDPVRYKNYFLTGYRLVNSLTVPCTVFCALFANDLVLVALGPKWVEAVSIFRLLSPTILIFGIINPLAWLLLSNGLQKRSLVIALVLAPIVMGSYVIGLPYGPDGVAFAYSAAMTLWLVPHVIWCVHGTNISALEIAAATSKPLISAIIAAAIAFAVQNQLGHLQSPFLRLGIDAAVMMVFYSLLLLFVMGQKTLFLNLLRSLRGSAPPEATRLENSAV